MAKLQWEQSTVPTKVRLKQSSVARRHCFWGGAAWQIAFAWPRRDSRCCEVVPCGSSRLCILYFWWWSQEGDGGWKDVGSEDQELRLKASFVACVLKTAWKISFIASCAASARVFVTVDVAGCFRPLRSCPETFSLFLHIFFFLFSIPLFFWLLFCHDCTQQLGKLEKRWQRLLVAPHFVALALHHNVLPPNGWVANKMPQIASACCFPSFFRTLMKAAISFLHFYGTKNVFVIRSVPQFINNV